MHEDGIDLWLSLQKQARGHWAACSRPVGLDNQVFVDLGAGLVDWLFGATQTATDYAASERPGNRPDNQPATLEQVRHSDPPNFSMVRPD